MIHLVIITSFISLSVFAQHTVIDVIDAHQHEVGEVSKHIQAECEIDLKLLTLTEMPDGELNIHTVRGRYHLNEDRLSLTSFDQENKKVVDINELELRYSHIFTNQQQVVRHFIEETNQASEQFNFSIPNINSNQAKEIADKIPTPAFNFGHKKRSRIAFYGGVMNLGKTDFLQERVQ